MQLRDRILARLREPDYQPANELALSRQLGLNKKQRATLNFEVRRLLASGQLARVQGDRLGLPRATAEHAGRLMFRQGGSAYIIPDVPSGTPPVDPIQIAPDDTDVAFHGDRVAYTILKGVKTRRPGETAGRVLRVISRDRATIVGNLGRSGRDWLVAADDPRFVHDVLVEDPAKSDVQPRPAAGDKVVVRLNEWKRRRDVITGTIVDRLGRTHEPRAELLGVFVKYDLDPDFPADVLREADALPATVNPRELVGRLDYREVPTFTIDPDDAKDFDDALSVETLDNGETRIGIHIADVSHYVQPGTALDREAQRRGNSTYLVGTVIPMLPEKLSNGLCSLVEGQIRLTKAVFLTFAKNGRLVKTAFANTAIRSRKRLTYKQAYALLFENDLERVRALPVPPKHQTGSTGRTLRSLKPAELADLQTWVRQLWSIASKLRTNRMAGGALDLDMPETKIFVDEQGYADRLERVEHDESHQLIEEFMLAANEAVARVTRVHHLPSLYRVHDEPDPEKLNEYRDTLATFDLHVGDLTKRDELTKLLVRLRDHPQGYTLRTQLLRSLRKAAYRATADGHFGLNKRDYTHFTSPIRRYADLVVHRVFDYYLIKFAGHPQPAGYRFGYDQAAMQRIGEHLSLTETNSQEAERESVKIKLLEFFERQLERKEPTRLTAIITDVRSRGFFVELEESMTFGFVSAENLPNDTYVLNAAGTALVGRRRKQKFELGARLDVVVKKVDRFRRQIDFAPAG
ncbi:RNB domain-containing ribonuclease [Horticoccus luteus]|uniref:Ribonuclease R n=1 Tax=Horticoccus luteus TaxID=2862869 RepID=A0A8F9XN18_9BACT|nr:RNB domain-containing ribonuclease [Horticoccus luteus]QYM80709.1 RNB domain-containing ribonuclease [Horticoccus luteus]